MTCQLVQNHQNGGLFNFLLPSMSSILSPTLTVDCEKNFISPCILLLLLELESSAGIRISLAAILIEELHPVCPPLLRRRLPSRNETNERWRRTLCEAAIKTVPFFKKL